MEIGFVTAIAHDSTFEEVLAFAAETGYDVVEPMCWPLGKAERRYAGITHIDVADFGPAESAGVKELCERYDLPYNSGPFLTQLGMVQRTILRLAFPGGQPRPKPGPYRREEAFARPGAASAAAA